MILFIPRNSSSGTSNGIHTSAHSTFQIKQPKLLIVLLILLLGFSSSGKGQTTGDYKANAITLNWDALSSWLIYNGSTWSTPTTLQGYPGYSNTPGTVTILTGQIVTLNISPANAIENLDVQGTGKLTIGTTLNKLKISGNISFGTGPSPLYDPINMKAGSGIGEFEFNGTSQQLISGDIGGNCYFYNFYVTGSVGVKLNHDIVFEGDLTVNTNRTFDISTYLCNKTSAPDMTFTLQPGSIFRLSGTTGGSTGSNFPIRLSGGTFAYSIDAASTIEYYGVSQTISPAASYGNLTLSGSGAKTTTGTSVNGILSLEGTATTTGTSPTYGPAATLQYKGSAAQTTGNELPATFSGTGGVIINNNFGVTLNSNATVSGTTLISSTNSGLIIPKNKCLTTNSIATYPNNYNQIYIQAGKNETDANGSLIFNNTGAVYGTVEMYSKAAASISGPPPSSYKWQFFGIPLQTLSTVSPTFDGGYVRQMHEDIEPHWESLTNTSTMSAFTGYEITQSNTATYIFQGQLVNGDHTISLTYTNGKPYAGQNLIGNPYTAAIDITKLVFTGNVKNTVYLYNTGSYADWQTHVTSTTPTDSIDNNISAGQYTAIPKGRAGDAGLQHQIPSMQAFLVIASDKNASVMIPYASVANTMVSNTFPQRSKDLFTKSSTEKTWTIVDVKGSRFSDRMWIFTDPGCTHSFDNGWDGEKFLGSYLAPQIYAMEADGDYQVNSIDDINNTYLGFQAGEDSLYTLIFTHQNLNARYQNLYLVDSVNQKTVDITTSGTKYTFTSVPTNPIIKRFKIVTNAELSTNITSPLNESIPLKVFSSQHTIFVENLSNDKGSLFLYDIAGRFIHEFSFTPSGITTLRTDLSNGTYLVKAKTNCQTISKQLLLM